MTQAMPQDPQAQLQQERQQILQQPLHRVAYVEDEPDIQAVVRIALEAIGGMQVTLLNSGEEAIRLAAGAAPQLLLMDVMMPGMDGPATLEQLRRQPALAATPVIFMTAKTQSEETRQLLARGAIGVISKPFDPMTLAADIRQLWQAAAAAGASPAGAAQNEAASNGDVPL